MSQALIPQVDTTLRLDDGRTVAYAGWSSPSGRPVFCFHGMPGSRLFFPDPGTAAEMGVHAITIDRPGIGGSDPHLRHRAADGPADVVAVADHLGLERFGVIGVSAGSVYALACAALIPERLTGVAFTNSASAMVYLADDPEIRDRVLDEDDQRIRELLATDAAAGAKEAEAVGGAWVADLAEHPERLLEEVHDEGDAWFMEDPERRAMFVDSIREGVRQGIGGVSVQLLAQLMPWGFRVEEIGMPVHAWLGANDRKASPDVMRRLTDLIPTCQVHVWDDAGHLGIAKHLDDVLEQMPGP